MKLTVKNGQLDLPCDFRMPIKRSNPFFSDEGDASIPITLPSSSRNLAALGHLERIDRAETFNNKVEAFIQVGPVQKHGQLLIDTVRRRGGVDVAFAIDSGDLYVKNRDKTLRELFDGITVNYGSVAEACAYMQSVYCGNQPDSDFRVFPVAVSPYEEGDDDNKHTVYQYNNEDDGHGILVFGPRMTHENGHKLYVPNGYGIAPFLKLQRLVSLLFTALGYTVVYNCFDEAPFDEMVIVHNCADSLVTPVLHYSDLVPSCTLGDFLKWLLAKFHVQPVVDSESRMARIVRMEALLKEVPQQGSGESDIAGMVEGDWEVFLSPPGRVVLRPSFEIEGTEPAAETLDELIGKYGGYVECDEDKFETLQGHSPAFNDCLIMRKATGEFFLLERELATGEQVPNRLGTNYFTYDRKNSDEAEEFSQDDVMPLMLYGERGHRDVAPYIGERVHRRTSYNGKAEDGEQKIIIVQARTGDYITGFYYRTTGTTQNRIPYKWSGSHYNSFSFGLDNHSMYGFFWAEYNKLKLNSMVKLKGRVKYDTGRFLSQDMSSLQFLGGQRLLPVEISSSMAAKTETSDAEFVLVKDYLNGTADTPVAPMASPGLKWVVDRQACDTMAYFIFLQKFGSDPDHYHYHGYDVTPTGTGMDKVWIGTPIYPGEHRELVTNAMYTIHYAFLLNEFVFEYKEYQKEALAGFVFDAVES